MDLSLLETGIEQFAVLLIHLTHYQYKVVSINLEQIVSLVHRV